MTRDFILCIQYEGDVTIVVERVNGSEWIS